MSGNRNAEEGGGEAGGEAAGVDWMSRRNITTVAGVVGVVGVGVFAFLRWQMYQSKKMKEMELEITRNRVYIRNSEGISVSSLVSVYEDSTEKKKKEFETALNNTVALCQSSKLDVLEDLLVKRQHLFCSYFKQKSEREKLENEIRKEASTPIFQGFDVKAGLEKIFKEDQSCGSSLKFLVTGDKRRNGCIMWEQLREWRNAAKKTMQDNGVKNLHEDP